MSETVKRVIETVRPVAMRRLEVYEMSMSLGVQKLQAPIARALESAGLAPQTRGTIASLLAPATVAGNIPKEWAQRP